MNPIGITLPIKGGGNNGYFIQSYDTITQIKSNIVNLLSTNRGERRMQPLFGSGIQELVFDQNTEESVNNIIQTITDDIHQWIPGVSVKNVELNISETDKNNLKDIYLIYVKIQFTINNQSDSLTLTLNKTNI
jgi:phage baseplate assembly protein W